MPARTLFARFVWIATAVVAGAACGGSTSHDKPAATGGSATGGSTASGGRAATGGAAATSGGRSSSGGQTASGGMGATSSRCELPKASGPCEAYIESYWYNQDTGQCESFVYGGCEGNANRFETLQACREACGVAKPGIDFCNGPNDCALISAGCCAGCEPVSASDLTSVNIEHINDRKCEVACGACPPLGQDERATGHYFKPGCEAHKCTVVDIRETEVVNCERDSDCVLRLGSDCCERCSGEAVVAVNRSADLLGFFCPGGPTPCPACVPQILSGYSTACATGRCSVVEPPCTLSHPCR